jgi:hypothetical protein
VSIGPGSSRGIPGTPLRHRGRAGQALKRAAGHGSRAQYGTGGSQRRSGLGVCAGPNWGRATTNRRLRGTGRYSVGQPDQSGTWSVPPGSHPWGWRSAVRKRIGTTSRPQVQPACWGRGQPATWSPIGGPCCDPTAPRRMAPVA